MDSPSTDDRVHIIAIGASAGGLEALRAILEQARPDDRSALVVIQHLAPNHTSMTAELLARHTGLPVQRVNHDLDVRPGHVYTIEPNTTLQLDGNTLRLNPQESRFPRPIDRFFASLAEGRGPNACVVVLSGTGSDGTDGARAVKEAGGIVVVQAPETARFDGMPRSVIAARSQDLVLAPQDILPRIRDLATHKAQDLDEQGTVLERVLRVLSEKENVNLQSYREPTVRRRIERRVALAKLPTISEYVGLLTRDGREREALIADLFVGVTRFFRDAEAYDAFRKVLTTRPADGGVFRAWVCGCSTGEEAYSVAMTLWDVLQPELGSEDFKIFATDVNENAIRTASRGTYPEESMEKLPPSHVDRFFHRNAAGDFVCEESLRSRIVFSRHDALRNPPFSKLDLVVCRNVLIYLQKDAQEFLLSTFSFSLLEGGLLWLGPSEGVAETMDPYTPLDSKWRLYRNTHRRVTTGDRRARPPVMPLSIDRVGTLPVRRRPEVDWRQLHDDISRGFLPSHIIVDQKHRLLAQHGEFVRSLLRLPEGPPTTDVRNLLPVELRPPVEQLMASAQEHGEASVETVRLSEGSEPLTLHGRAVSNQFVVLYFLRPSDGVNAPPDAAAPGVLDLSAIELGLQRRVETLEHELQLSKETVQNTVEELESSNEELMATNEELLASNEELQSVNEELQSVNEELHTLNAEHQDKIHLLGELNRDHDTLLATVDHGVLFLDGELRVRRFNPPAQQFIALMESDVGRPFSHLTHKLGAFPLLEECARCLREGTPGEEIVQGPQARVYLVRVAPINNIGGGNGIVLSITDVTLVESLRKSHTALLAALDNVELPLALLSLDGTIEYSNNSLAALAGRDGRYLVGSNAEDLVHPEHAAVWREAVASVVDGKVWEGYVRGVRADGADASEVVRLTPSVFGSGEVAGIVRLTLLHSHKRSGEAPSSREAAPGAFYFSGAAGDAGPVRAASLIAQHLVDGGAERERALRFVVQDDLSDLRAVLDAIDQARGRDGESAPGLLSMRVTLGEEGTYRLRASLRRDAAGSVTTEVEELSWQRTVQRP